MSTNQQKENSEEVDLGSLFIIIGKGFSKLFNFIGNIFKGIFDFFITILLFLRENILKIGAAAIIGLVIGIFLEINKPKMYGSELLLEPNFNSARQLYYNINYYNDLVKQKDTLTLQKTFKIDKESAASLKKFEIEPIRVNSDIINSYDELVLAVDTLTIKSYNFEDFKSSFTDFDYKIHKVTVNSAKNDVFSKLDDIIISSVINNKYFNRLKELTNENLNRTDAMYRNNLAQVDSLRRVYMQVMLEEAKKQSSGTSIDLGGNKKTTKEIELFQTNRTINEDLEKVIQDKAEKYEVLNVISKFQPIGYEIKGVTKNYGFLLALLGSSLVIVLLLLIKLNKYLENYKK